MFATTRPKPVIGQQLWYVTSVRYRNNRLVTVTKVGRKYFETDERDQWHIDTWRQKTDYTSGTLYLAEQEWLDDKALAIAWGELQNTIRDRYFPALTLEQIQQVMEWMENTNA